MDDNGKDNFVPHSMHVPHTADGSGNYSADGALGFYKTNAKAIPLVLEAIKSSAVQPGSVFTIVDYGTADGGTSMPLMYESVRAIREKYGEEMPITIIYEDQPTNDFKSLFMRLQGFLSGPRSHLIDFPNVFAMACGTNFYSQCVPSNTVHVGFSACSFHWLREKPCDINQELQQMLADKEEKQSFSIQAEKDWELFLSKRAEELVPGGVLILAQLSVDGQGKYVGETNLSKISVYKQLGDLWKELVQDGLISQEEFKQTTFISYFRTEEEFKKPFNDPDSPVRRKGLELISTDTHIFPCGLKERWMKEKGDPEEHAKRYVNAIRLWSYATMYSGLSDSRSAEEKSQIVDEFYDRYESRVAKSPGDHGLDFVITYIVIRKRQ